MMTSVKLLRAVRTVTGWFHTTWLMASKLTRRKSSWLFFLEYNARVREKVYQTYIANIDELKHRLVQVWTELDHRHRPIDAAIAQWRRRLNACDTCVKAQGGHFEQHLRSIHM